MSVPVTAQTSDPAMALRQFTLRFGTTADGRAFTSNDDPTVGVLDREEFLRVAGQVGADAAREVFQGLKASPPSGFQPGALAILEAALGWSDRKKLEKAVRSRSQVAVKAFGLLPLEGGGDEALERFLLLQEFRSKGKTAGPDRRANEHAAYEVAMANFAQTAGYSDVASLEIAFESRLARRNTAALTGIFIDQYRVDVGIDVTGPKVTIAKDGAVLRSVPKSVRTSAAYLELQDRVAELKGQRKRVREAIESFLTNGQALSLEELQQLNDLPTARPLLRGTLFIDQDDQIGLLDTDSMALNTCAGTGKPIQGPVQVAHSHDLLRTGTLAAWQAEIVRRRIVQPCKQAFRELYVITPAEQQTETYSLRFSGHQIDPSVAARLFYSRGWRVGQGMMRKNLPRQGLVAWFEFPGIDSYNTYLPYYGTLTSGPIHFIRAKPFGGVALADVPPRAFSEVMRDADLVVSIAHTGDAAEPVSNETFERRGELVRSLIEGVGVQNVSVAGHYAYVSGKLANYRVHLGSGAIHIMPGAYLCIVADTCSTRGDELFLPFAEPEARDSRIIEIVSKILLLAEDELITDESILRQIQTRGGTAPPPLASG